MKLNCNVIRDLIPLYVDQICSEESKELVEEHLAECEDCSVIFRQMRSEEVENCLEIETVNVLRRQAHFFKQKSAVIGTAIAGVFMIPVLVCLIVNIATGAALDWFFIVLASLLTATSLTVVPLMVPDHKMLWTMGTFTVSLFLLFGVICIYTHQTWVFIASPAVLFGLSVCFLPFVVYAEPIKTWLGRKKGLTAMAVCTFFYAFMMISIKLYTQSEAFGKISKAVSVPCIALIWILFLLIRYLKCNGLLKAGICTLIVGGFGFAADYYIERWIGINKPFPVFRPFIWNVDTVDGNVKWIGLLGCTFAGIALIVSGIKRNGKKQAD